MKKSITVIVSTNNIAQWGDYKPLGVFMQLIDYERCGDFEGNKQSYTQ